MKFTTNTSPLCLPISSTKLCDQEIAEDLTAEVFTRMLANLSRYTPRGKPILAWLYTIARNLVIDHYRQSKSASHLPLHGGSRGW